MAKITIELDTVEDRKLIELIEQLIELLACGLIAGLGIIYYFSWWAGVLNYAETIILGG